MPVLTRLLRRTRGALHRALSRRTAVLPGRTRPAVAGPRPAPVRVVLPDHVGPVRTEYSPELDGAADPGEIVWTWVGYEEDPSQGKDRPVLVVGWDGPVVLALMLTSKDHTRDAAREARRGRVWMDIGSGTWDSRRRASEVRLDRVLRLDPDAVRREGAIVDRALFERVVDALGELRGR
ncbi:type II toxin-antitoxin system PemK/MazF family toxin [Cellulomonas fulva]|uniref:type II toxin-antitoxin system PemK/MazF family toxin n=1 Tax=Cellulomonas fulva TaxID=2835530 RepID=UPI0027DD35C0|nr:type II toxin-antitoxin system PemK/MazF family toxin [Cellulomonas fulva]